MDTTAKGEPVSLTVMGAGGHAREVRDIAQERDGQTGFRVVAFHVEPGHLPAADALALFDAPVRDTPPTGRGFYVSAVGDPHLRARLAALAEAAGLLPVTLVSSHARVIADPPSDLGAVIFPLVFLSSNVNVGKHVHINAASTISHDVVLEDYATVGPGCRVTGGVHIESYAVLGAGSVVLPGRRIGTGATVGAGAVVAEDVPPGVVVMGVPASISSTD